MVAEAGFEPTTFGSVSYTHLDVYKRQVLGWLALLPEKQAEAVRQGAAGEVRADDYPSGEPGERWVWLHSPAAGYGPALDEVVRRLGSPAPASFWPPDGLTGERAVRALEKRAFGGR